MILSNLKVLKGAKKRRKIVGRGNGSGHGKTACRGSKGQRSRSGGKIRRGFEGGQMPLFRRVPKGGFRNPFRKEFRGINIDVLQKLADEKKLTTIDIDALIANGLASKKDLIKILGRGELTAKLEVKAHAFSATALSAIEAKGGTATKI